MPPLPQRFFAREVELVARELLGCRIQRGEVVLRITEVEAYGGPEDSASHARFGRTDRNAPMWGPAGRAYVYLCYGMHDMLNVVADRRGRAAAVLIRSCEPLAGLPTILARRGASKIGPKLLAGPGKVGAALGLDPSWSHHPLHRRGELVVMDGDAPDSIRCGPRVGIDFAAPEDRDRAWRFAIAGHPALSAKF
ncbi:DNA-3-methyladenine glycosylase [Nannocystaceae bacterium ST9]